jgi:hypothetical protein
MINEDSVDGITNMSVHDIRQKLAGLHFLQESLTRPEREILYLAEALLRIIDKESW